MAKIDQLYSNLTSLRTKRNDLEKQIVNSGKSLVAEIKKAPAASPAKKPAKKAAKKPVKKPAKKAAKKKAPAKK